MEMEKAGFVTRNKRKINYWRIFLFIRKQLIKHYPLKMWLIIQIWRRMVSFHFIKLKMNHLNRFHLFFLILPIQNRLDSLSTICLLWKLKRFKCFLLLLLCHHQNNSQTIIKPLHKFKMLLLKAIRKKQSNG